MKSHNLVSKLFRQFLTMWSHVAFDTNQAKTVAAVVLTYCCITLFVDVALTGNHKCNHFCCSDHSNLPYVAMNTGVLKFVKLRLSFGACVSSQIVKRTKCGYKYLAFFALDSR